MKLDFKKLRRDIKATANELRVVRANPNSPTQIRLRELMKSWPKTRAKNLVERQELSKARGAWNEEYENLRIHSRGYLREKMTILCSIRAAHRGKLHQAKIRNPYCTLLGEPKFKFLTLEDQEKLVAQHIQRYEIRTK